jgi:hypothetical protein
LCGFAKALGNLSNDMILHCFVKALGNLSNEMILQCFATADKGIL